MNMMNIFLREDRMPSAVSDGRGDAYPVPTKQELETFRKEWEGYSDRARAFLDKYSTGYVTDGGRYKSPPFWLTAMRRLHWKVTAWFRVRAYIRQAPLRDLSPP